MQPTYDCVIIGGGPAGLYASFYAGLRDMKIALVEALDHLGGKLSFYPEKMVWDVGALPPSKGKQIQKHLIEQARTFQPDIYLNTKIIKIEKVEDTFLLHSNQATTLKAKTVLLAIGGGIYTPKKLTVSLTKAVQDKIFYHFPDPNLIKGKELLVSGGGNSAVDYAIEAHEFGAKVTISYRGEKLKGHESQVRKLTELGIPVYYCDTIEEIRQQGQKLQVKCAVHTLSADYLLIQHGYEHDDSLFKNCSFDLKWHNEYALDCQQPSITSEMGIFATGDIQYYPGKVNLLTGAFNDSVHAVNQIKQYLDESAASFEMVSSHNEKFHTRNQALFANQEAI